MFKVGDKVRNVSDKDNAIPIGFETVVTRGCEKLADGRSFFKFDDMDGDSRYRESAAYVLVPTGPVVTETVTKTRIVPGVFSHVVVETHHGPSMVGVGFEAPGEMQFIRCMSAEQLDAAAAVLSALAKGLRDVG